VKSIAKRVRDQVGAEGPQFEGRDAEARYEQRVIDELNQMDNHELLWRISNAIAEDRHERKQRKKASRQEGVDLVSSNGSTRIGL
jgi:hypothetical protein